MQFYSKDLVSEVFGKCIPRGKADSFTELSNIITKKFWDENPKCDCLEIIINARKFEKLNYHNIIQVLIIVTVKNNHVSNI